MIRGSVLKFDESDTNSHKERHIKLHNAFDELIADYIQHHPDKPRFSKMSLIDLME